MIRRGSCGRERRWRAVAPLARTSAALMVVATALLSGRSPSHARAQVVGGATQPAVYYYSFFNGWPPELGPLDAVPRFLEPRRIGEPRQRVHCDASAMVTHRSRALRYSVAAHPSFVARLARFEDLATDIAVAHYGRAPRRLVHRGAFSCREARGGRGRISEHALGNALDLSGFDFGPLRRGEPAPPDMPRHLRRAFSVRVVSHWRPRRERDAYHATFLHRMAEEVRAHPETFRGIVGPPRPRHHDHLHLDAAPWTYAMFGYDP